MTTFDQRGQQINVGSEEDEFRVIAWPSDGSGQVVLIETGNYAQAEKLYDSTPLDNYVYIAIQKSFKTWERLTHKELPD